ncbi:proteasome activator complex subunit 4-like [Cylas formicarius]|uniref:proteasome activator complex subunit 4-like n=1 Tax=Cylas formicarius TaxID=197179 RepID=UPI0029589213|nr:proteasome activator complex subunit 4-like [Cylas formicarius]XP_060526509.1 proteasome activator complex subunit 4-like [Cylas formicarius]
MDDCWKKRRKEKLGFLPQRENVYNELLPYSESLDEESTKLFIDIKTNLVKSILAQEMRPGCALWTSRLNKYIKIYGMKFSKEDHIALIKLFYELVTIPDLEPTRVNKCALTLTQLLKKKYLITRDELELEWRPLYDLCLRTLEKSKTDIGMYRYFTTFEGNLFSMIRVCRIYFPASSTQEILDEFRPKLCPFNSAEISSAIQYMELFLPSAVKPEEADISYNLWFNEFMNLWEVCHNAGTWENHMMWILTGLARFQIGHIDWEPYIAQMFVRFQRTLQLPVKFKQRQVGKQHKIDVSAMALWIVCVLHSDHNSVFFHLEKFMRTLESYFYPANVGRWTFKLRELLRKLSYYFVQRVHNERHKNPSWDYQVPQDYKLREEDIDRFVEILKPCVEQAMFSRLGSQDVTLALSYLASLRPKIIVPMTLDKLYASMDSLTEPHKLTSSMMGVIAVGRHMVQGPRNDYPEGPTHIIPLLIALLPGIDPNDIRKSYVTFNFMVHFVNMIPLINTSDAYIYYDDMTEEEHIVCEATANFEDFVLQFFDRLMLWVESSSLDFVRLEQMTNNNNMKNRTETITETAIGSVVSVILTQCSPDIFQVALKKMYNFVISRILEVQVSGKMVAIACHCFSMINPKETLKLFVPYLCDILEELLRENPHISTEEHVDAKFLYNLLILSELVDGKVELLNYLDRLTSILDKTLHMTCQEVNYLSSRMLELLLYSLTDIRPNENRSCGVDYSTSVKNFLAIREWGKSQNVKDLKLSWYVPGANEVKTVEMLVWRYLLPELNTLTKYSGGELILTRQELKASLVILVSILSCHLLLPMWDEPAYQLVESVLEPWAFNLRVSNDVSISMPDGSNIRKAIVNTMHSLQKKLLTTDEGDTQSIKMIIDVYNIVLFNKTRNQDFEFHWKTFHMAKKLLEDRVQQKKLHLRHLLIDRVMLQQEFRIASRNCSFTRTHKQILEDFLELGVSQYSEVRIAAQSRLYRMISYFPYCSVILTNKIKEILLINSEENHEKFKGCLYILLGPKGTPIIARHDWNFIKEVWPLVIRSMPSEKPSIVKLVTGLTDAVYKYFPTIAIKLMIPERTLSAAYRLADTRPFTCDLSSFKRFIDDGKIYLKKISLEREQAYNQTINNLLDACESGNLHWRYNAMAITFIKSLVHFDVHYNPRVVKYFLQATISESLNIRKNAMKVLVFITIQNKPKFKKIDFNPFKYSNCTYETKFVPGEREDNLWLLYNSNTLPKTVSQWEELRYVHDQITGYYAWPKEMKVYAPPSQQKSAASRMEMLSQCEKELYGFFSDASSVDQLVKYLSMEDRKGQDQFNAYRFLAFKNLFKIFEDAFLPILMPHIERLVQDNQEASQRCAAEMISALIRGSKHWQYSKVEKMWTNLIPIINTAIVNMLNETQTDWALCISMALQSRDPNRNHWLLEFLMDEPLKDSTSFVTCARLHLLSIAVSQQSWRNAEIFNRMFNYFKPHLAHPFQNVREKISSFLTFIFGKDLVFPSGNSTRGPKIEEFFDEVFGKLERLYEYMLTKSDNVGKMESSSEVALASSSVASKKEELIRLFKVVSKFVSTSMVRANFAARPEFFKLLPLAAILQSYETDEEVSNLATNLIVVLAQTMTKELYLPYAIEAIKVISKCPLWSARSIGSEFIPIFIFYNMATINKNKKFVEEIQNIVLELLEDDQVEVRIAAAHIFSNLLHCHFIPSPSDLLATFKQKARTKLKTNKMKEKKSMQQHLLIRHAGVLGLCSFISAHPYDVPDYLPGIFADLGSHLSDPQPIPATIRKTMSEFKRTHHENWECHKLKFTEEELSILSDLLVPPSYYV